MFIFLVSCLFYFAFIVLRALLLVSLPTFPCFPSIFFSATHVPNQFFILSSIYNHVSRQFALGFFVLFLVVMLLRHFILFLLFKFSFLVHIRFLFF